MKELLADIENLNLYYKRNHAVKNITFSIYQGEILAVIGPNGSGKTSTIECIEGLRKPSSGKIEVLGLNPQKERRRLYKKLGVQLQDVEYPEKIKVKELCSLFASFYKNPADFRLLLPQFGLQEKADRLVKKLSGGERRRLSVLLALLPRPALLILDEATTGLDPEIRRNIWDSLQQIRQAGTGILLISHYMDEVEKLADRLLYIREGAGEFLGTKQEFREYARTKMKEEDWSDTLTLEDIYLFLSPKTNSFHLGDIV